jgi:hypothetical protein
MDVCLIYGPVIGVAVSMLKKIPFVKKNPKVIAFVLSIAITTAKSFIQPSPFDIPALIACVLADFAGAVATHEVVVKPVSKRVEI